ncbi:PREDICTED: NADH dehydrogenase [ubiquinone] flavoprotein 3, mitochondrial [Chrysochloris asiatica]|uniref:NADH dehydrogenase [ubiquinone] flavoprotein 3, mitochondrial n=1 Tax=Chrysochloris asiatica TaxID=185453 RepID=A0A9B0WUS5_CHRAS|nr:PREDICTED: NADH dehydrogenase [ubiquinone] flavoprotein 3, mitochondrial [Chrysochloris asiatica]
MAASLLLRQGRAGALKTRLQPGVLRGLASTVSLATKSGKSEKGLPPDPKKQSTPKKKEPAAIPVEPFDNTTYKNLQHHNYTVYTFSDVNLDLLKFRMPQPASGRESPRH